MTPQRQEEIRRLYFEQIKEHAARIIDLSDKLARSRNYHSLPENWVWPKDDQGEQQSAEDVLVTFSTPRIEDLQEIEGQLQTFRNNLAAPFDV